MFPVFEKLIVILRFNSLLKNIKDHTYKLSALCKKFLKLFGTYKCYFTLEADRFVENLRFTVGGEILAFTESLKSFAYFRLEIEEAEKIRVD